MNNSIRDLGLNQYINIDSIRDLLLNWNKLGCESRNLGDLLYLINNEWGVCFEIVRHGTTPEFISSTGITQGAYSKENPVLLGCEYLTRTNRPVDIFASE
ncbi:hypothetical protein NC651_002890 [Populus alba x Populus x berolinensis]|nr:hypothetical protein NC651_002890 [Populus alba x Populus x berolinensis]